MAAVRDEDQLARPRHAGERRDELGDDALDVVGLVVDGEDERDQGALPRATVSRSRRTAAAIAALESP